MNETVRRKIILTVYTYKNLHKFQADFLKTIPANFAAIWVKRGQKAGVFLCMIFSKNIQAKEKEREKKSEEDERKRREKSEWSH